jgi:hypothetical protein
VRRNLDLLRPRDAIRLHPILNLIRGHMSRFGHHIRVGTQYEYLVNGVHKNPQTVKRPGAEPLHADALERFRSATAALLADLAQTRISVN